MGTDARGSRRPADAVRAGPIRTLRRAIRGTGAYRRLRGLVARATAPLRIARIYRIYRKDLTAPLTTFRARAPIRVTRAGPEEIPAVARLNSGASPDLERTYAERLEHGHHCFTARVGDELVGYNWLAVGRIVDFDGEILELGDDEVFCLDAFTAPAWRGKAIHTELLSAMLAFAKQAGYRRAYTEVSAVMRRSWKTHRRLDWELTGRVLHVRGFLGLRPRIWRLTGSRYPVAGVQPGHEGW